jgi:prepilin-type N-terminal cleavage/methylation domain-containing protein
MRGFSLVELMIALVVFLIACGVLLMGIQPALKQSRVNNAYNTALNVMRQTRDNAIAQRQTFFVSFFAVANPCNMSVTQGSTGLVIGCYTLPTDVFFMTPSQFASPPTMSAVNPDGFGNGGTPIAFDQGVAGGAANVVYFMPDGSAQDAAGNINNGVLYLARPGDPYSARALTLWGATGRLRGWHLMTSTGGTLYYWRQQ